MIDEPKPPRKGRMIKGLGILLLLHQLLWLFPIAFFFIGIVQLLYVIPAAIFLRKETATLQGILIGAGITFLVNAACFGLVMSGAVFGP